MFVIEDEWHAEQVGRFDAWGAAGVELHRLAAMSWDEEPNRAPCGSWRTRGRSYDLVEYDGSAIPWREVARTPVFEIGRTGTRWSACGPAGGPSIA